MSQNLMSEFSGVEQKIILQMAQYAVNMYSKSLIVDTALPITIFDPVHAKVEKVMKKNNIKPFCDFEPHDPGTGVY